MKKIILQSVKIKENLVFDSRAKASDFLGVEPREFDKKLKSGDPLVSVAGTYFVDELFE